MNTTAKNTVTAEEIDALMKDAEISISTTHEKCTVVSVKLKNGFVITETSACVDKANYDVEKGKEICLQRIKNKLWELEGYCLQKFLHYKEQEEYKQAEQAKRPVEKFLFIEDGSADVEELKASLAVKNPEIFVVVYRQGSKPPEIVNNTNNIFEGLGL